MYFFLAVSAISSAVAWYMQLQTFFTIAVAATIFIVTYNYIMDRKEDIFMEQAIHCMTKTECCCVHKLWSEPQSVVWTTTAFKILAGITATIATLNTHIYSQSFATGHYFIVATVWSIAILFWFLSCAPIFICLIQCAAKEMSSKTPKPIQIGNKSLSYSQKITVGEKTIQIISGSELIVRFRVCMTVQLIHDLVIGVFWLYLALMLYDISDDNDDSEWRTIFLSMMSWHIVFVTLHHIYLKEIRSCVTITRANKSRPCCAPSEADKWWSFTQLIGLALIYTGFIWRMREPTLTDMGCSIETLLIVTVGIAIYYLGMSMQTNSLLGTSSKKNTHLTQATIYHPTSPNLHF